MSDFASAAALMAIGCAGVPKTDCSMLLLHLDGSRCYMALCFGVERLDSSATLCNRLRQQHTLVPRGDNTEPLRFTSFCQGDQNPLAEDLLGTQTCLPTDPAGSLRRPYHRGPTSAQTPLNFAHFLGAIVTEFRYNRHNR